MFRREMKVVSGHQPVYLPWLGFFHKASLADVFVYMDDVQYLKQDWNNRNQIKTAQGSSVWLTVPVQHQKNQSIFLKDIRLAEEKVSENKRWPNKHFSSLKASYGKSPYFKEYAPFFEWVYFENQWEKLADLNLAIIKKAFEWFKIFPELIIASEQGFQEKKSDLVLEHGLRFGADLVLTGTHGKEYISVEDFKSHGIEVEFQDYRHPIYSQRFGNFLPNLSFVDLLFNHGPNSREILINENISKEDLCRKK